jgi:uncharacterized protein with FMN-binding domain
LFGILRRRVHQHVGRCQGPATVTTGRLESVKVLKHRHGPGHGADAIIDRVIAAQSLKVDAISGATASSKVMLKAIQSAPEKGQSRAGQ